ncbi:MAG: methyltransferase domain-containing protein [Pseudomonadota bacterium]|nr:methyltransferase domain-containing protein [Pseudomonadota bacterium]
MSDATREKWDRIYNERSAEYGHPVHVVEENLHLLPSSGKGLELACGLANNSFAIAARGIEMAAWDISAVAAERVNQRATETGAQVTACARDIVTEPPTAAEYDVVVVSHFLDRSLAPAIITALIPGGLLFYQTFTQTRVVESGPKNSDWRLADGELLTLFAALKPLVYREEGLTGDTSKGLRNEALLVAQKPDS